MKILLAGGKGYIGSNLLSRLELQASIKSIDYYQEQIDKNITKIDLTDIHQINQFTENCDHFDALIFLVGLAHAKGKAKDFFEFKKVNYQTLVNLLTSLKDNNKVPEKIIFSSTISVYGEKYHQYLYNEESRVNPFSPYAVTKLKAEQYLLDNFSARSWILRFAPVYSSDFLLNINRRTRFGSRFYKVGNGSSKLSLCNIDNIKAAVEAIIEGKVPAGIYNISDYKDYTYDELLKWQNVSRVIRVPLFAVKLMYHFGKLKSAFIKENTVKLISDNVFPSDKIRSYVNLPATINDVKYYSDQ